MSVGVLRIHPEVRETEETIRYEFQLEYPRERRTTLFYDVARVSARVRPVAHFDGILCAVVLHAMKQRLDVQLRGPATVTILRNLSEFQQAWSRWRPDVYQRVTLDADDVVTQPPAPRYGVIAAFSGGADSHFTLYRHNVRPETPPHPIAAALMVHGFDVSLANQGYFDELVANTATTRERAGVTLRTVRTNSKELGLQNWEDSFAAELAACFHLCGNEFAEGLIASGKSYEHMVLPYGSNPATDRLLSGASIQIAHDGAGYSRTDKLEFLAQFPEVLRALKVCWEGAHQSRNCGVCEKCVRTRLNLLAAGVADPPCFEGSLDLRLIDRMPIRDMGDLRRLISIRDYAEQRGVTGEWLRRVRARVRRESRQRTARQVARTALASTGLLGSARKLRDGLRRS